MIELLYLQMGDASLVIFLSHQVEDLFVLYEVQGILENDRLFRFR